MFKFKKIRLKLALKLAIFKLDLIDHAGTACDKLRVFIPQLYDLLPWFDSKFETYHWDLVHCHRELEKYEIANSK